MRGDEKRQVHRSEGAYVGENEIQSEQWDATINQEILTAIKSKTRKVFFFSMDSSEGT